MRNEVLFVLRKLGDALAKFGQEDDGIIAEAALAAGSAEKFARTGLLDDENPFIVEDEGEGANEGAAPVFESLAVFEEEGVALRRIELAPSILRAVACRKNTGRPAEAVDGEARVVGKGGTAGEGVKGSGLDQGVLDIGSAVFLDIKGRMPNLRGSPELMAGEEGGELDEFVCVACRDKEFHGGSLACSVSGRQV